MSFEAGRAETIRYHTELFQKSAEPTEGSWLDQPTNYMMSAFELLDLSIDLSILDLGAGNGRHTLPIAKSTSDNSLVTAIDLLPVAVEQITRKAALEGVAKKVQALVGDVEHFDYGKQVFDLVISCSCIEHVSSLESFRNILESLMAATKPGGYNAFMIASDGREITETGLVREPLMELNIPSGEVNRILEQVYAAWLVVDHSAKEWVANEERDGEEYDMSCTCVQFIARKPS